MRVSAKLIAAAVFGTTLVMARTGAAQPRREPPCQLLPEYENADMDNVHTLYRMFGPSSVCKPPEEQERRVWWSWKDTTPEVLTTVAAAATLGGVSRLHPTSTALIGPSFVRRPTTRVEIDAMLSPRYAGKIGHSYAVDETVPGWALGVFAAVPSLLVLGATFADVALDRKLGDSTTRGAYFYDASLGAADAILFTLLTTELFKRAFGRLRPDFQARVRIYYCTRQTEANEAAAAAKKNGKSPPFPQLTDMLSGFPCGGVPRVDGFTAADVFDEGRVSFPSGHSSLSFAVATYGVLLLGGQFQWGDSGRPALSLAAVAAQAAMLGTATWIAASRVGDGRHNLSDVLTGAAIGAAWANVAYWRRFDTRGRPRRLARMRNDNAKLSWDIVPMAGGLGVAGTF